MRKEDVPPHQVLHRRLDLGNMPLTMQPFANNHPQLLIAPLLRLRNGRLGALDGFFDVEAVQVDSAWWRVGVVGYLHSAFSLEPRTDSDSAAVTRRYLPVQRGARRAQLRDREEADGWRLGSRQEYAISQCQVGIQWARGGTKMRTVKDPPAGLIVQLILLGLMRLALIAQLFGAGAVARPVDISLCLSL